MNVALHSLPLLFYLLSRVRSKPQCPHSERRLHCSISFLQAFTIPVSLWLEELTHLQKVEGLFGAEELSCLRWKKGSPFERILGLMESLWLIMHVQWLGAKNY